MKSIKKKLLMSVWALSATAITLTSVTYAWFASNREAWTDEFDLDVQVAEDLMISVDGSKFYASISNDNLKKAIVAKMNNVDVKSETLTKDYVNKQFDKVQLSSVTTSDAKAFKALDSNDKHLVDNYYQLVDAEKGSYISFDLYFRITTNKNVETPKSYYLGFVGEDYAKENDVAPTSLKMTETEVLLYNDLTTQAKTYKSGESITVNGLDAMRIAVSNDTTTTVFEPYAGLGSYAIAGETDSVYNPSKNAMLTYFNNTHEGQLAPISENKDFYKNTVKTISDSTVLGNFKYNAETKKYEDLKLTVSIWMEGYDADYFMGIENNKLTALLNFVKKEATPNE